MSLLTVWLSTFGMAVLSAVIPIINIEIYLLGASALAPREFALPLVLAGTIGQVLGKIALYYVGTGALKLPGKRLKTALERAQERVKQNPRLGGALLFASASVGLPPFYLMTIVAGAARMNLLAFIVLGFLGRMIRFGVIVMAPHVVKGGWPW